MPTQNLAPILLRRKAIEQLTGLSRTHIYALMKQGDFPQSVPLAGRAVAWVADEVYSWIDIRTKKRGNLTSHNVA